jgi:hypothetical protein
LGSTLRIKIFSIVNFCPKAFVKGIITELQISIENNISVFNYLVGIDVYSLFPDSTDKQATRIEYDPE